MSEHRSCPRWQTNWKTKVQLEGQESPAPCTLCDINFKGARICLEQKLAQDSRLKINLCLSEDCSFEIEVWVVWHKYVEGLHSHGLYFTKIRESDKEKLYQFIQNNFKGQMHKQIWQDLSKKEEGGEKMQDNRIFERFLVSLPLRFLDLKKSNEGTAKTRDISAKGVGFVANETLPPQTPLELWLEIPDKGESLYTRGEVVWSMPQGVSEYRIGVSLEKADLMGLSRVLV